MNYKKPQRNNNLKETGKCLVYNFSLNTKEEMYYCGVEKTVNGNIYHMLKRYGKGRRAFPILVNSKTTNVYLLKIEE